jgi:hypothetical protein
MIVAKAPITNRTAPPTRIPMIKSADRILMAAPCGWPRRI